MKNCLLFICYCLSFIGYLLFVICYLSLNFLHFEFCCKLTKIKGKNTHNRFIFLIFALDNVNYI